jgi:hypothetical protein
MPNEYTPYTESNGEGKNMAEPAIVVGEIESEDFIPYTQKTLEGKKLAMPIILIIPSGAKGFPTREEMGKAIADKLASTFVREFPAVAGIGKDIITDGSAPTATGADGDYYFTLAFDAEWKIIVWEHANGAWEISTVYPPIPAQNFRWVGVKNAAGNIDGYYIVLGEQTPESLPEWELLGPALHDYYKKQEADDKFATKTAVESAQSAADTALGTATDALTTAGNAQSTASNAASVASNAATAATTAQNTANNAQTAATNAAVSASAAGTTADNALKSADRIKTVEFYRTPGQHWIHLFTLNQVQFLLSSPWFENTASSNTQILLYAKKINQSGWITMDGFSVTPQYGVNNSSNASEIPVNTELPVGIGFVGSQSTAHFMVFANGEWCKIDIYHRYQGHGFAVLTTL